MKLSIATLADAATAKHGQMNIVGTFDTFVATDFPATMPAFAVAMRATGGPEDTGSHTLKLKLLDGDRRPVTVKDGSPLSIEMPFEIRPNPVAPWARGSNQFVVHMSGVTLPKPDSYVFAVRVDGEIIDEIRLFGIETSSAPPQEA